MQYTDSMAAGDINLRPRVRVVHRRGATALVDADGGYGYRPSMLGIDLAVSLARAPEGEIIDPWDGHTLEWTADASAVTVASPSPLFDAREGGA